MKKSPQRIALFAAAAVFVFVVMALAQARKTLSTPALPLSAAAPAYDLPDQNGVTHTLASDKGKVILLAFYPADFTGGCTLEAHALTAAYPDLAALGVTVYGVSVQDPSSHKAFCSKEGIPYTLLADTQKTAAKAYGVLIPGIGIANRVTFIIGANGQIAYVDKNVNAHLMSCGADWVTWIKAHPALTRPPQENRTLFDTTRGDNILLGTAILGQRVPDFCLPNSATGHKKALTEFMWSKKAVVVIFLSTHCPVSNAYNDRMVALAKKYAAHDVAFVGIDANTTEPPGEVAAFARDKGFPFPVLKDADDRVADAYNAHVTPEAYVINNDDILVYHGRIDNAMDPADVKTHELADAIDATLAGQPIAKPETKAFGCSIKR